MISSLVLLPLSFLISSHPFPSLPVFSLISSYLFLSLPISFQFFLTLLLVVFSSPLSFFVLLVISSGLFGSDFVHSYLLFTVRH